MSVGIFYWLGEKIVYRITGVDTEAGEFNVDEIEAFLEKKRLDVLNVIISKPQLVFRRMEFPFRSRRKINMVMPSEMEDTFPESIDRFFFSFDFAQPEKNRTIVNVYAIPFTLLDIWNKQAKKHKAKVHFFSDTIIFHQFVKQSVEEKNYIAIYSEGEYLLLNLIENGVLTGSYSYVFTEAAKAESIALINGILEKKDFTVFICASQERENELRIKEENLRQITLPAEMERRYLFHFLSPVKKFKRTFLPLSFPSGKKIPVAFIALFAAFLIISLVSSLPYFKAVEREKEVNRIEEEMRQIFTETFPDVRNIVNPLAQTREKIMKEGAVDIKTGVSSVLKVMSEIVLLFPENNEARVDVFRVAGDTIALTGTTDSLATLEEVKESIEQSDRFTIIDIGTISFNSKNRVNFSMTLKAN